MKNFKMRSKGITLVALVITIVILLILAGISIAQLTGNGLFENAKLAKEKSDNAQQQENDTLSDYESKIGEYIDGTRNQNENNYSTEEQVIGTWIDGKKLYRKVYEVNSPSTSTSTQVIDTTHLNVDTPVDVYGVVAVDDNVTNPLNIIFTVNDIFSTWFNRSGVVMYCSYSRRQNKPCKVVLEYTKTTDIAINN